MRKLKREQREKIGRKLYSGLTRRGFERQGPKLHLYQSNLGLLDRSLKPTLKKRRETKLAFRKEDKEDFALLEHLELINYEHWLIDVAQRGATARMRRARMVQ